MFSARSLHHVVADERIEIVRYVIFKRIGYAVRAAAGIGIGIGSRQAQAFGLVLEHCFNAERSSRAVNEAAVAQQEIVAVVDQRQVAHSFIIALYRKGQVFVQLRTTSERYLPCVL